jgi:hypothetical protein
MVQPFGNSIGNGIGKAIEDVITISDRCQTYLVKVARSNLSQFNVWLNFASLLFSQAMYFWQKHGG